MSLTNFNLNQSLAHNVPQQGALPPAKKTLSPEETPFILKKLGQRIQANADSLASPRKIDPSRLKNYQDVNNELQSIFLKINALMQKNYQEDSSLLPGEIQQLEGEVKDLELKFGQMLPNEDVRKLREITNGFHAVLSSAEDWLCFKERYFIEDDELSTSLESIQPSIDSDLHGWSPAATKGVLESVDHLTSLIEMSDPRWQKQDVFTPELLTLLAGSVRSASWACSDWLHGVISHHKDVLTVAQAQWEQANKDFEASPTLEAYTQMQLSAQQLLAMKQVLIELKHALPYLADFASKAKEIDVKMQQKSDTDEEYADMKNIRNDLKLMDGAIAEAKKLVHTKSGQLDEIIRENHLVNKLSQAQNILEGKDYHVFINEIRETYEAGERTLDRYVAAKRQLSGILSLPNAEKYGNALDFCRTEEQFFRESETSQPDFDELVLAQMMQLGQPQPGIFTRIWQALPDPAGWSDTTKRWMHVSLLGLQLVDQVAKMAPQKQPVPDTAAPTLTQEEQEMLSREAAFLGNTLTRKFEHLKTMATHESKKTTEIKPVLEAIIKHYSQSPSPQEQRQIIERYEAYRTEVLLNGKSDKTFDWIVQSDIQVPSFKATPVKSPVALVADTKHFFAGTHVKTEAAALPGIEAAGPFLNSFSGTADSIPLPAVKQNAIEELQEASKTAQMLNRQLRQCSRVEFLKPSRPMTPKALLELREELAILRHTLFQTMEAKPAGDAASPEWVDWNLDLEQQCHSLKDLEGRINEAMSAYEEAVAMNNYQSYAMLDVFGNKHKNLVKAYDIATAIGIQGLEVPLPQGIASGQVMKFLNTYAPEIFEHWERIGEIYAANEGKGPILENEKVLSLLKAIDQGIADAFLKASKDEAAFTRLGVTQEMKEWLAKMAKENKFLMVRSTGAEDSKKSANAGGNASISYVKPNQEELCKALGEVVRSYFSVGSLQKRLNANLNPFEDELKVAVTTQELIGEPLGGAKDPGEIPVSLVLFTNEPLFIGDEKFRAMRISATYGHGEGVVGNQGIASDTALVLISTSDPSKLYILYDNQEKPERLAPMRDPLTGKISLQKIPNSEEMAKKPALNEALISRLYEWGVIGEKYFENYPTDMEIVVKGEKIFPVQARPVNRPKMFATYLDLKKISGLASSPIEKTLRAEMIVTGKASVVEITKPEEILIAETLEKAEGLFKKGQHKLVVVGKQEPANSHPVVNFSALGMPCLFVKNLDDIQNLVKELNPNRRLAVCVQSATVSLWDAFKENVQEYTTEGFVVHPAKIAISLPFKDPLARHEGVFAEAPEEVKALLTELRSATTSRDALKHLQALQSEKWINALESKINELEGKVARRPLFEKPTRPVIEAAKSLKKKIDEALSQIETLLDHPTEPGRLELLIHVKTLETLLFQQPSSPGALAQHSRLSIEESFAAADAIMLYQSQLPHAAHFADLFMDGSQSPVKEAFSDWQAFLLKLEPLAEKTFNGESTGLTRNEISRFKTVLHTMRQAGVLPLFMTFFLGHISQGDHGITGSLKDPIEILRTLSALMPSRDEPIIEEIFVRKKEIQQLRNDLGQIANPKTYPEIFGRLQNAVDNFLHAKQPWLQKEQWKAASPITRSIAIESMNELVDVYDTAIKAMKASQEIKSDVEKSQKFKEMLGPYLKLLKGWSQQTVGEEGFALHSDWSLARYIERIESEFLRLSDTNPNQLRPSREFSVSAAVLGSGTAFERHLPQTLEDVFTLIHQNLMVSTATLTKELFSSDQIQNSLLPANMKRALDSTSKIGARNIGARNNVGVPQLIGIDVDKTGITFYYNVPLRNHSGKFSIRYDRYTEKVTMEAQFLGQARDRWDAGAERVAILNAAGIIPLHSKPKVTPQELTFNWDISNPDLLEHAFNEYQTQAVLSLRGVIGRDITEFVQEVDSRGSLYDAFLLFSKEKPLSVFGREMLATFVDKTISKTDDSILNSVPFLKIALRFGPISDPLIKAILLQFNGSDIETSTLSEVHKDVIVQYLARFKNDPTLLLLLPIREDTIEIWRKIISDEKNIPEAIAAAQEGFKDWDWNVRESSIELLTALVEQNRAIPEAIEAAQEGFKDGDWNVRKSSIELWVTLVAQNNCIPEAIAAAKEGFKDGDWKVRESALILLAGLVAQNNGIPEAIAAAQEGIKDENWVVQGSALNLLAGLVAQNNGIPEAIAAAQEGIKDENWFLREYSLKLWKMLVAQNNGIPEAIAAAQEGFKDGDSSIRESSLKLWEIRESSLKLWEMLVAQNNGIPEAIAAAQEGIKDEDWGVRESSFTLWEMLVAQNNGIPEAIATAQAGIKDEDWGVRESSLKIWETLVAQNNGIPEAIEAAQVGIKDEDWGVRESSLKIWETLVAQNNGIPEAIAAAQAGIKDEDWFARESSLKLLAGLVAQNNGIPEAIATAQAGIKDEDRLVRESSLKLWEMLVKFTEGKLAAQKLVDEDLINSDSIYGYLRAGYLEYVRPEYLEALNKLKDLLKKKKV